MKVEEMIALASDKKSTAKQLASIVDKSVEINRLLAVHPNATEDMLGDIACFRDSATSERDAESRRLVVRHPRVSVNRLIELGHEYPSDFLKNPALERFLNGNPDLFDEVQEVLEVPECPIDLINRIAVGGSLLQRASLLLNPTLHESIKELISPDRLHSEALSMLEELAEQQGDNVIKRCIQLYADTSRPYCLPRYLPFDRNDPEHRVQDQVLCGFPFTSAKWPWPAEKCGEHMHPIAQINLKYAGKHIGEDIGSGLLQIWGGINYSSGRNALTHRVIPEQDLTDTLDQFYPENPPWLAREDGDLSFNGCVNAQFFLSDYWPFDADRCRVEWVPVGRMFYPEVFMRVSCPVDGDHVGSEFESIDCSPLEELAESLTELQIPRGFRLRSRETLFHLGGYSDGGGNDWHCFGKGKLLLYHSIDSGIKITIGVTFSRGESGEVTFFPDVSSDN